MRPLRSSNLWCSWTFTRMPTRVSCGFITTREMRRDGQRNTGRTLPLPRGVFADAIGTWEHGRHGTGATRNAVHDLLERLKSEVRRTRSPRPYAALPRAILRP